MAIQKRTTSKGGVKYRVLVRDPRNRWYPTKSFTNRKDAERYERTLLIKKDRGVINSTLALRKMKVDQYFMLWRKKCRRCSEGWAKSQDQMYRSYIHPVIGHKSLCDLRPTDIGNVIQEMAGRG